MRVLLVSLYMALALCANAATADTAALAALRDGDMKKLNFHDSPQSVSTVAFTLPGNSGTATLADYQGKYILVNFWATWCAPCRKEMPTLSELQSEFGGDSFQVVTIATGRNSEASVKTFFAENGISNLPANLDPKQALAREMAILGLPITVLIDPEGREIARLMGDADWSSESAKKIISSLTANM